MSFTVFRVLYADPGFEWGRPPPLLQKNNLKKTFLTGNEMEKPQKE